MAPIINIKIYPPSSTADTNWFRLHPHPQNRRRCSRHTWHPWHQSIPTLRVRFLDNQIASSIGISEVALHSTSIALPAHVFADDSLQQSLFGISDITNRDYDTTFRKDRLYLYQNDELVHYSPKLHRPGLFRYSVLLLTLMPSCPCHLTKICTVYVCFFVR